jgi:hypothetical protein
VGLRPKAAAVEAVSLTNIFQIVIDWFIKKRRRYSDLYVVQPGR